MSHIHSGSILSAFSALYAAIVVWKVHFNKKDVPVQFVLHQPTLDAPVNPSRNLLILVILNVSLSLMQIPDSKFKQTDFP